MNGWPDLRPALRLGLAGFLAAFAPVASAQESPAGPVIAGYERLRHGSEEPENAAAGLLLLAELNCTTCHQPSAEWRSRLEKASNSFLDGVGSRRSAAELQELILQPQHWSPGTRMPALLQPGVAKDEETARLLAAWLSQWKAPAPPAPAGDADHGRQLYHQIGCVACHAPQEPPPRNSPDAPIEPLQLPSVPLGHVSTMERAALVAFLLDPLRTMPDARMPSSHLSLQEAADMAAFLQAGHEPPAFAQVTLRPGEEQAARDAFSQLGCGACHVAQAASPSLPRRELAALRPDHGCLSAESSPGAHPVWGFTATQRADLQAALRTVQAGPPAEWTAAQKVDWRFSRLNCYACHVRGDHGGPEAGRLPYFTVNDSGIESLGEMGHLPPRLDIVGRKLTDGWFQRILRSDNGRVRPYLNTRMPAFAPRAVYGTDEVEELIPLLREADKAEHPVAIDTSGILPHQRAEKGRQLMGITGLSCVSCHGLKDRPSLGPPVIRLTWTTERLLPEYFKELVLDPQKTQPGTVMPPLFTGRKTADKDIEAVWTYLREIAGQPLPDGLLSDTDFELKPEKAGHPIVFRSFIETGGTHAIGVGFPQGLHACFDALHCRWTLLWRGRFLDAMENWQDRAMKPVQALGQERMTPPIETAPRRFRGYRLEPDGTPVMLYTEEGAAIEDRLAPDPLGQSFIRTVRRTEAGRTTTTQETWKW